MVLALDISLRCTGYTVFSGKDLVSFGTIKTDSTMSIDSRVAKIASKVSSLLIEHDITHASIEAPAYGARGSMSYYIFGLHFYLVLLLMQKVKLTQTAPTSLKKFATGNGRAKKEDMVSALPKDIKKLFVDNNLKKSTGLYDVTDAYFLGLITT